MPSERQRLDAELRDKIHQLFRESGKCVEFYPGVIIPSVPETRLQRRLRSAKVRLHQRECKRAKEIRRAGQGSASECGGGTAGVE